MTASSPTSQHSHARFRNSLGTWLLAAFAGLALLPAITSLPGWIGSRAIQVPLDRVATVVTEFGEHDRGFRRHVRSLYARLFVTRNFADRAAFEETAALIDQDLASMRVHIEALEQSNLVPSEADHIGGQDRVEQFTSEYLALVAERFDQADRRDALSREIVLTLEGLPGAGSGSLAVLANIVERVNLATSVDAIEALRTEWRDAVDAGQRQNVVQEALNSLTTSAVGPNGLFDTLAAIQRLNDNELEARLALRTDVVSMIARLVEVDAANDQAATDLLRTSSATLRNYNRSMLVSVLASTLLALFVVVFFVRGNVLRRLSNLTNTTRRLTSGSLERPIEREGNDELAELGDVLETFRLSALELRLSKRVLEERSEELEQVNAELDKFAYVASHDLKAPLRAVATLVGFLREDIERGENADAGKHLNMIESRTKRLDALLDSLLAYSRAGRKNAETEHVDLRELVESAAGVVSPADGQTTICGNFGKATVCRAPLEQIIRNLVDNAFKHNDEEHGSVTVECNLDSDTLELTVKDNGPGIPPEFHARVFDMFRTLKPRDQVEGSGMGLAILRKLVDSYGGSITLESEPATRRGTIFRVTWPVEDAEPGMAADDPGNLAVAVG